MKLRLILTFCLAMCLSSCDVVVDGLVNSCHYGGNDYQLGTIHPNDPCLTCTAPSSGEAVARWKQRASGCCINRVRYDSGDINPNNPCEACLSYASKYVWTPRPFSTPCPGGSCDSLGNCD